MPGMLYAKILRPPAHGAKLKSVDTSASQGDWGRDQWFHHGDLVAVLHEFPDVAEVALGKMKAEWDTPAAAFDDKTVFDHLQQCRAGAANFGARRRFGRRPEKCREEFDATYLNAYVAHSPMEPHAALCQIEGDKATVWASTQNPFGARDQIAGAIGFPAEKSASSRRLSAAGSAARPTPGSRRSRATCQGRRQTGAGDVESRGGIFLRPFRPAAVVKINSGVDAAGKMAFWDYDVYFAGERGAQQFYSVPNHRTASARLRFWRTGERASVCHHPLACARQQHQHVRPRIADGNHGRRRGH